MVVLIKWNGIRGHNWRPTLVDGGHVLHVGILWIHVQPQSWDVSFWYSLKISDVSRRDSVRNHHKPMNMSILRPGIISINHRNVSVPCMGLGSKGNPWIWEIAAISRMQPTSRKTSGNWPRSEDNLSCVLYDWLTGMLTVCNWKHLDSGTERLKYIQNSKPQSANCGWLMLVIHIVGT